MIFWKSTPLGRVTIKGARLDVDKAGNKSTVPGCYVDGIDIWLGGASYINTDDLRPSEMRSLRRAFPDEEYEEVVEHKELNADKKEVTVQRVVKKTREVWKKRLEEFLMDNKSVFGLNVGMPPAPPINLSNLSEDEIAWLTKKRESEQKDGAHLTGRSVKPQQKVKHGA